MRLCTSPVSNQIIHSQVLCVYNSMSSTRPTKKAKLMQHYGVTNFTSVPPDVMLKVNQELLRCPDCKELKPQAKGLFKLHLVLLECSSPSCETQWFLCTECRGRQRVHITNKQKLRDHMSNHHSEKKAWQINGSWSRFVVNKTRTLMS